MRTVRSPSLSSLEPVVVRKHLARIVRSPPFARSNRLQRFLAFIVESELAGRRRDIQEYTIGLEVFDREESFDPRSDSIVRVEARRLRKRLKQYYAGEGRRQSIRIVLPQRDAGGLVKALVHINADSTMNRCYNGITGSSSGSCGFATGRASVDPGLYFVDFGFQVSDRLFLAVSTFLPGEPLNTNVTIDNVSPGNPNFLYFWVFDSQNDRVDRPLMIAVY